MRTEERKNAAKSSTDTWYCCATQPVLRKPHLETKAGTIICLPGCSLTTGAWLFFVRPAAFVDSSPRSVLTRRNTCQQQCPRRYLRGG